MLPSFVILFFCALVTAFSAGDPQEKWGGYGGHGDISHGGNNIGNGDVGGIVGDVGIGGGSGGGCDPAACDAKVGHAITKKVISPLTCRLMKVQKFGIPIGFLR